MPAVGYLGRSGLLGWGESAAPWLAFLLLIGVGTKMIRESFYTDAAQEIAFITHRVMLTLAVAIRVDAMAAGFWLALLHVNPWIACLMIGVTTALVSVAGVYIGYRGGTRLAQRAAREDMQLAANCFLRSPCRRTNARAPTESHDCGTRLDTTGSRIQGPRGRLTRYLSASSHSKLVLCRVKRSF